MTNKPKFTPGPWRAGKSIYQSQARVVAEKGGRVADVFAYEEDQAHANAALIAAAPEMYELLQKMYYFDELLTCRIPDVGEVLEKARGEK